MWAPSKLGLFACACVMAVCCSSLRFVNVLASVLVLVVQRLLFNVLSTFVNVLLFKFRFVSFGIQVRGSRQAWKYEG